MTAVAGFREQLASYFDDFETMPGRTINFVIAGLILVSCGDFIAQTYDLPAAVGPWLNRLDNGIFVLFTLEYALRLWSAPRRSQHFLKFASLIDLVVLLPFLVGSGSLSFLRIFRWLRILRLIRFLEDQTLFAISREDSAIATRILFTIFAIIFVYSGLIYQVEHNINPEQFGTFLDAVYYAVSSISTAGFGDINPISQMGRLLSVLMMLTGLVLIPWQLGDLFKGFVRNRDRQNTTCPSCGLQFHDIDAHYCRVCGGALIKPATGPISTR